MAKVTLHKVSVTAEHLLRGKNGRVVAKKVQNTLVGKWLTTAGNHYDHMLTQVEAVMEHSSPSVRTTGEKRISFSPYRSRRTSRISTSWEALNPDYARRSPRSRVFWYKNGKLARQVRRAIAGKGSATLTSQRATVRPGGVRVRAGIAFGKLPEPLDSIIRRSFATGTPQWKRYPGVNRRTYQVIVFPERDRPLVGLVASRLGRDMIGSLRKVKR